ncbi:MAG: T9SS type A sorting domain-containing protein [Candidatus Cloacimonetes bacterium]|nr:T9SS type A sorting domain-containing protein [Candidatus Cloacimonadota bacterium]
MKKIILFAFLLMSISLVFADLEVDIPFDLDIIGEDFSSVGPYEYESDWITITNNSSSSQAYTFMYTNVNTPTGWTMSVCNDIGTCYMPNSPVPFDIPAGESVLIHILINVTSTDGFGFSFTFNEGDLTEPMVFDFTFNTADNVSADDELLVPEKLSQNYPNPFNPSTTISYELSSHELANASLTIYNTKGQLVRTFKDLNESGNIVWDGRDSNNNIVNSGVYFYKMNCIKTSIVRKMILIK